MDARSGICPQAVYAWELANLEVRRAKEDRDKPAFFVFMTFDAPT